VSEFVLPLPRLLATPALEPLIESAASLLLHLPYASLGRWLRTLDAAELQRLRDLRRGAITFARPAELKTYATLVKVLALGEGTFVEDEADLHAFAGRLSDAVTVTTLVQLGYAIVDWSGLSIDPAHPIPWALTDAGKRHVRLQQKPR
jgi:hypothetical protein